MTATALQRNPELADSASALIARAHSITVADRPQAEAATDLCKMVKTLLTKAEEARDGWVRPLNQQVKRINAEFKAMTGPLEEVEAAIKTRLTEFHRSERLAAEAEAARLRELEAQDMGALENARAVGADDVVDAIIAEVVSRPDPSQVAIVAPVRSDYGAVASIRKGWAFEVEDAAQVPREYLTIDPAAVRRAIAGGVREIPGLRIFADDRAVIR